MTSKELPVPDPHRQAVPGPQSKGGQDASWAWSSDSDEGGATLPTSRGRSRTLTRSGSPLSTSPSQACSQSHSPGRGHGIGMGIFWHVEHDGLQVVIVIISSCSPARQSSRFHICCTSKRPTRPWEPQREYMRRRHRKPGEMLLLLFQTPYKRNVTRSTFKETLYKIQCWPGIAWLRWKSQALWKSRRCNGRIRSQSTF